MTFRPPSTLNRPFIVTIIVNKAANDTVYKLCNRMQTEARYGMTYLSLATPFLLTP